MTIPSITGTTVGVGPGSGSSIDISFTVPSGANAVVVGSGGFRGSAVLVDSVQGDPDGTPYDFDDVVLTTNNGAQWSGLHAIFDTNANWPGTGAITIRVTIDAGGGQIKAAACAITDFDTSSGTNGTNTATGTGSAPSSSVTSTANALDIACAATYSADVGGGDDTVIYEDQNGTSSSSLYMWHEDGAASSNTVEGNANVSWAMCVASFEGTGGGGGGGTDFKGLSLMGCGG